MVSLTFASDKLLYGNVYVDLFSLCPYKVDVYKRQLLYVDEADIIGFKNKYDLPVEKSACPADGNTKREYAKDLLRTLNLENPGVKQRMFTAILNADLKGWPTRYSRKS